MPRVGSRRIGPLILVAALLAVWPLAAQELGPEALRSVKGLLEEKLSRSPAQRKMDTSLVFASRTSKGETALQSLRAFPRIVSRARVDGKGMVVVDIRAEVTDGLLQTVADLGGQVISQYPAMNAVRARVPIGRLEELAARPEVRHIGPEQRFLLNTGSVTSQGDVAHAAAAARTTFGINGTGVKVGVLSDGVNSLAARQATGDLPPVVTIAPGQAGTGNEGTAMLEIVYDVAPGAQLFFATANGGPAVFAANILTLRNTYGCDVIIDDVTYFGEGVFQDGPIAQAVNTVAAQGGLFFSSAGNSGNLSDGTSGTWEGDFLNTGPLPIFTGTDYDGKPVHSFNGVTGGGAANNDQLTADADNGVSLAWSDPLGASNNDYDILVFDDDLLTSLVDAATNIQDGTQDPYEQTAFDFTGERIVVVLFSGVPRALHLNTHRAMLSIATSGAVSGHNGGQNTVSVAAVDARPGVGPFTGGAANPVETYSSDGPRRIFYNPNGTPITPGNLLFGTSGGQLLQKPDITAADCVTTTTPGFTPFCGTSAAAPHAGAIAALVKSASTHPSLGQVQAAMFATALDIEAVGRDRDSGVGIVMADRTANAIVNPPAGDFFTVSPCRVIDTRDIAGPTAGAPLTCAFDRTFTVTGGTCGVPLGAKGVTLNVTVTQSTAQGNLRLYGGGAPAPLSSVLNYTAGQTRANNATIPLSATGQLAALCGPTGTAHVIIDVSGYFQ